MLRYYLKLAHDYFVTIYFVFLLELQLKLGLDLTVLRFLDHRQLDTHIQNQ